MIEEERLVLTSAADWSLVADVTKEAVQKTERTYEPISPFIIPATVNAQYFCITANSIDIKSTWRWAGTIGRVYPDGPTTDTAPSGKFISDEQSIFLNRSQFIYYRRFFSPSFDFYYAPPKWLRDIRIRIHKFIGDIVNTRQEQLDRIEANTTP